MSAGPDGAPLVAITSTREAIARKAAAARVSAARVSRIADARAARMAELKATMERHQRWADVVREAAIGLDDDYIHLTPNLVAVAAYHYRLADAALRELAELSL